MSVDRRAFILGSASVVALAVTGCGGGSSEGGGTTPTPTPAPSPSPTPSPSPSPSPTPSASPILDPVLAPWACIGDSMTHGIVGASGSIPYFLTTKLGVAFDDLGVIAQTSTEIAARIGALPIAIGVADDAIPASGPVVLQSFAPMVVNNTGPDLYLDRPVQRAILGTLCGIRGYLRRDRNELEPNSETPITAFTFNRLEDGDPVVCPPGSIFVPDYGDAYDKSPVILRMGYNNRFDFDRVVADHEAVFAWNRPVRKKILLLDPPSSFYDDAEALAASARIRTWLADAAVREGLQYFPIHDYVASYRGLAAIDATPTEDDRQAIRDGRTPMSATVGDGLHYNATMNEAVANRLVRVLRDVGYI